jgi:hypothetical protein
MHRTHLVSVGTSLLGNASRALDKPKADLNEADFANYLAHTRDARGASAEDNALRRELADGCIYRSKLNTHYGAT